MRQRLALTGVGVDSVNFAAQTPRASRDGDVMPEMIRHTGGCHCGKVRFEVRAPAHLEVTECNCSMCSKAGYLHLMVPKSRFNLLSGEQSLQTYQFNTGTARHLFCSVCGVKSFYVPRSHPDGFSINVRCLDEGTVTGMHISHTDGRNWEKFYPEGRGAPLQE
jgi:hypothetical protein